MKGDEKRYLNINCLYSMSAILSFEV